MIDQPARGYSGLAVVALHALAIAALVGATRWRETVTSAVPMQVSLLAESHASRPERVARMPVPSLSAPAVETPAIPAIAVAAPAASATSGAVPAAPPAAAVGAPAAPASPEVRPPSFEASYLDNPPPVYPALSRRLNESGQVVVRVRVSEAGRAERVELARSSGFARLDRSALDAVAHWRFAPARQGARPVAAWVLVPVTFVLRG